MEDRLEKYHKLLDSQKRDNPTPMLPVPLFTCEKVLTSELRGHSAGRAGMPRLTVTVLALYALVTPTAGDPRSAFRPPRRSDKAPSLQRFDDSRNTVESFSTTTTSSISTEDDIVGSTTNVDATLDPTLDGDVINAIAFAQTSHDIYENDVRYANVVREAVDALEVTLLDEYNNNDYLRPDNVRRDATLREALVDLRDEIDRALPVGGSNYLPEETYYGLSPRRVGDSIYGLDDVGTYRRPLSRRAPVDDNRYGYGYDSSYDESNFDSLDRVAYADVGVIGGFMQSMTFMFSSKKYDSPSLFDDWMRCSTLAVPCSPSETFRRCTYEPKATWYRERRSRINAPLDWPYCADDLGEVYEFCTPKEKDSGVCNPRVARSRAVFERARALEYRRQTSHRRGNLY